MDKRNTIIITHGAGLGTNSSWFYKLISQFNKCNIEIILFDFSYMKKREKTGIKYPPNKINVLKEELYKKVLETKKNIFIAGKSMGGRVASMIADDFNKNEKIKIKGVIIYGYPFHPNGKPNNLRIDHLKKVKTPMLIIQGENDIMGNKELINNIEIDKKIKILNLKLSNHDLKPLKKTGLNIDDNIKTSVIETIKFIEKNEI